VDGIHTACIALPQHLEAYEEHEDSRTFFFRSVQLGLPQNIPLRFCEGDQTSLTGALHHVEELVAP